ncbi:MAG: NAD(+) synthase, partial [Gemmataceae bacterium]|nr:NAD(+) synthase [Gemmataceae bacterium]
LYNCAAAVHQGKLLALVPKQYLPNYQEFYEDRWFHSGQPLLFSETSGFDDSPVPIGPEILFEVDYTPEILIAVEICEDLWVPIPPSSQHALAGAMVILNLSASNEVIGKAPYRRQLVRSQSGRCIAAYVYCSSGVHESTTDLVFGGHCLIAENGNLIAESSRFSRSETLLIADVDVDRLSFDRLRIGTFHDFRGGKSSIPPKVIPIVLGAPQKSPIGFAAPRESDEPRLLRPIDPHPFVPKGAEELRERCEEIFHIQVAGLARRLEHIDVKKVTIGVSGGLDSTLALLVTCRTFDTLGWPRAGIHAWTMPGFGTTARTLNNARRLMAELGVTPHEADIRALCLEELRLLGHQPFGISLDGLDVESFTERLRQLPPEKRHDLTFENVQARMRTNLLMNAGFVVGTGDLSELALGWCTYNADHMSMYNPNVSIPKTLVRFLVEWAAKHEFDDPLRQTLLDIVATVISPELLPTDERGEATQATESAIGPYELHDFFLFHFLRYGALPEKILFLASQTKFDRPYSKDEIRHWLRVFLTRFFANQFKRSCLPDGPKVGSVSLSPRGDWRMPSDASVRQWLDALEEGFDDDD